MARKPQPRRRPPKADVEAAADRAEKRAAGVDPMETAKVEINPAIIAAEEIKAKMGRPTKYKPEYARVAEALCRRGATDFDLAEEFGVDTSTIWRWSCKHEDFFRALYVTKDMYDDKVERALAQRAAGYTVHIEKVFCFQGEIVRAKTTEHVPPDVGAAKLWLTNRRPDKWREAVQRQEIGAPGDFDQMSDEELNAHIESEAAALLEARKSARPKSGTRH